jgi:fumarylacetoacetase
MARVRRTAHSDVLKWMLNPTHDPTRRSWVASANAPGSDFPIQNLPFGVFRRAGGMARGGVAIGDRIFDLSEGLIADLFEGDAQLAAQSAARSSLNSLLALGYSPASALRSRLSDLLRVDSPFRDRLESIADRLLVPMAEVELLLPVRVSQFTDMCVSTFHISRCRGEGEFDTPVVPLVLKRLPVGYNGRASSVVVSGTPVRRPNGQWKQKVEDVEPTFGPEPWLDYELELGMWIAGSGNRLGEPIPIATARNHIFGFCLLNDWSARGLQMFESMLGPFQGKSFATTVSPWIVTAEALEPFRVASFVAPANERTPAPYLVDEADRTSGGYDICLEALVRSATMRAQGSEPMRTCDTNFRHMYWTWAQMLTHHASNGCNLSAGDLIGSGTCSGPVVSSAGCLLELTERSKKRWRLPTGEERLYLEDGDEVVLRARANAISRISIGFGDCRGVVTP